MHGGCIGTKQSVVKPLTNLAPILSNLPSDHRAHHLSPQVNTKLNQKFNLSHAALQPSSAVLALCIPSETSRASKMYTHACMPERYMHALHVSKAQHIHRVLHCDVLQRCLVPVLVLSSQEATPLPGDPMPLASLGTVHLPHFAGRHRLQRIPVYLVNNLHGASVIYRVCPEQHASSACPPDVQMQ